MNNIFTAFDQTREAKRKPRKVFDPQENQTKTEGENLCCPFCGQELAHTERSLSSDDILTATNYARHPSGHWIWPSKGAQHRSNHRKRKRTSQAFLRDKEADATPQEIAGEAAALKRMEARNNRQIVTNARTGETKRLNEKGGSVQTEVRADAVFLCRQCDGRVKIKVSN